ncbi:sensor histidine kinase [Actinotalea sp. JY-7876]|uniref:sensor histidine kinase n=2 Tax=unclassified Actinotalea TaxID=2638618 RepID=UPI0015F75B18|nr:sensor histidine kinase [Actinotalea sp. JY-7876]
MGAVEWWRTRVRGTPRGRDVSDAVLTGLAGLVLVVVQVELWTDLRDPWLPPWVHLPLLALGCLVMLAKRRHPLVALAVGTVLFGADIALGGSVALLLVVIDLLYSAALHTSPRGVDGLRTVAVAAIAGGGLAALAVSRDVQLTVFLALQLFALIGTPLWWGLAVRRQSELTVLAQEHAADLARLAALREADAVEQERARMARDLHDAIAGNLSAVAIHAEAALALPADDPRAPARDRSALEAVRAASVTSLQEMRAMIGLLRGGDDPAPAPARLQEAPRLVAAARAAGLDVAWTGPAPDALPALPSAVDHAAYRILQEALTNAAKHAATPSVSVDLALDGDGLRLSVTNPAAPPRAAGRAPAGTGAPGGGLGLLTMRERAEGVGGRLAAGPADVGAGGVGAWSVVAALPTGAAS